MQLRDIADYVSERISSDCVELENYITTDCLLSDKQGRAIATNLPPKKCALIKFQKGDILVSNIRPYLKKIWYADCNGGASTDVLVFRAKNEHLSTYLYSILLQDSFYNWTMKGPKGSRMPRGDKNQIMHFPIVDIAETAYPVGKLIMDLNEKILINRQINQNLEALARQLYDYWFVQFDFPNEEGKPYKSSGGKMIYNPILKREFPEGWEYLTVNNITNVVTGKEDANFSTPDGKYPFFTCSREKLLCSKAAFNGKAILIAGNGDFNVKHYNGEFNAYQRTYVLIPKDEKYYGVLYLAATDKIDTFKKGANGSIVKFITKGDVENIGVLGCNNDDLYATINNLILQIENNDIEIASLTKQRDELLPLLMNGQVNFDLSAY